MQLFGHLANLLAFDGDESKQAAPNPLVPDAIPGLPEIPAAPTAAPAVQVVSFPVGALVRDILSGREGEVVQGPEGYFGAITFVRFGDQTNPMRNDQLEMSAPAAPAMPMPEAPVAEPQPEASDEKDVDKEDKKAKKEEAEEEKPVKASLEVKAEEDEGGEDDEPGRPENLPTGTVELEIPTKKLMKMFGMEPKDAYEVVESWDFYYPDDQEAEKLAERFDVALERNDDETLTPKGEETLSFVKQAYENAQRWDAERAVMRAQKDAIRQALETFSNYKYDYTGLSNFDEGKQRGYRGTANGITNVDVDFETTRITVDMDFAHVLGDVLAGYGAFEPIVDPSHPDTIFSDEGIKGHFGWLRHYDDIYGSSAADAQRIFQRELKNFTADASDDDMRQLLKDLGVLASLNSDTTLTAAERFKCAFCGEMHTEGVETAEGDKYCDGCARAIESRGEDLGHTKPVRASQELVSALVEKLKANANPSYSDLIQELGAIPAEWDSICASIEAAGIKLSAIKVPTSLDKLTAFEQKVVLLAAGKKLAEIEAAKPKESTGKVMRAKPEAIKPRVWEQAGVEVGKELPKFAWPGGYPLFYVDRDGSEAVCSECVNTQNWSDKNIVSLAVNYEDDNLTCAHCGKKIAAAYKDNVEGAKKVEGTKVEADKPTTPMPAEDPGANMTWAWNEANKKWYKTTKAGTGGGGVAAAKLEANEMPTDSPEYAEGEMMLRDAGAIAKHVRELEALITPDTKAEPFLVTKLNEAKKALSMVTDFLNPGLGCETPETEVAAAKGDKPGLLQNIERRKKRLKRQGKKYRPLRPGEEGFPSEKSWDWAKKKKVEAAKIEADETKNDDDDYKEVAGSIEAVEKNMSDAEAPSRVWIDDNGKSHDILEVASWWHGGQFTELYAFQSNGGHTEDLDSLEIEIERLLSELDQREASSFPEGETKEAAKDQLLFLLDWVEAMRKVAESSTVEGSQSAVNAELYTKKGARYGYANLYFAQGEDANEMLDFFDENGAQDTVHHLLGLVDRDSDDILEEKPWGESDDVYKVDEGSDKFRLSVNERLGYIGLSRVVWLDESGNVVEKPVYPAKPAPAGAPVDAALKPKMAEEKSQTDYKEEGPIPAVKHKKLKKLTKPYPKLDKEFRDGKSEVTNENKVDLNKPTK